MAMQTQLPPSLDRQESAEISANYYSSDSSAEILNTSTDNSVNASSPCSNHYEDLNSPPSSSHLIDLSGPMQPFQQPLDNPKNSPPAENHQSTSELLPSFQILHHQQQQQQQQQQNFESVIVSDPNPTFHHHLVPSHVPISFPNDLDPESKNKPLQYYTMDDGIIRFDEKPVEYLPNEERITDQYPVTTTQNGNYLLENVQYKTVDGKTLYQETKFFNVPSIVKNELTSPPRQNRAVEIKDFPGVIVDPATQSRKRKAEVLGDSDQKLLHDPMHISMPRKVRRKLASSHEEMQYQRFVANNRERRRTQNLNDAFSQLKRIVPASPADRLSKMDTLKLATQFIEFMYMVLFWNSGANYDQIVGNDAQKAIQEAREFALHRPNSKETHEKLFYAFNLYKVNGEWNRNQYEI